jgi:hypothetical protein
LPSLDFTAPPLPYRPVRPSGDNINRSAVAKYPYKTKYYIIISVSNRRF